MKFCKEITPLKRVKKILRSKMSKLLRYESEEELIENPILSEISNELSSITIDLPSLTTPEIWGSIVYHEHRDIVGDGFNCKTQSAFISGYTRSADPRKYCIGGLKNFYSTPTIERTKLEIKSGVELFNNGRHIWAINKSDSPIFIQSENMNYCDQLPLDTVYRLDPQAEVIIFDQGIFFELLIDYFQRDVLGLVDLCHMCVIKVSFVEGWGGNYSRKDVTHTPCWFQLQLHAPIKMLSSIYGPVTTIANRKKNISLTDFYFPSTTTL